MKPTKTEAIKRFLLASTHPDLADLYNINMETQVNVAEDGGTRIDGDFKGKQWHGFTDGSTTWKPIRIPWNAATDPKFEDSPMTFDLERHAEGIGMTGWDWRNKKSLWMGYDFDAITGHADAHTGKLTDQQLKEVQKAACDIPWVTVRRSTSGNGLHLYVFTDGSITTANHNEHAALARAVIGMMAAKTGFDFHTKVDICGGNMWVFHRKMKGTDGLILMKKGEILHDIPHNWRDHIAVIKKSKVKTVPIFIQESQIPEIEKIFDDLTGQRANIQLDDEHRRVIDFLNEKEARATWDQDRHMLVTHTYHLKEAHEDLQLRGVFDTISTGTERGHDQNCFLFPLRKGAWAVRRFTPGVSEHPSWTQDGSGWTQCFAGNTEILTRQGVSTLRESARLGHAELQVLTDSGMEWLDCEIKSFGEQNLMTVLFKDGSSVQATPEHGWLYGWSNHFNPQSRCYTKNLKSGTKLPVAYPELPPMNDEYWRGYAHGFIFGDGSRKLDFSKVTLYGNDIDLLPLLVQYGLHSYEKRSDVYDKIGAYKEAVTNLPAHWKKLPNNPTRSYALGFVLGLNSADGSMGKTAQIFQSDIQVLYATRDLARWAGLRCFEIRPHGENNRKGAYGDNPETLYCFHFSTWNLGPEYTLRKDYKRKMIQSRKPKFMEVQAVIATSLQEEVFCAVVPQWHNFTLANGVITGNCYFNREPDLATASKANDGIEHKSGGFVFPHAAQAIEAAKLVGVNIELPTWSHGRKAKLKESRDGKLIVEVEHDATADAMAGGLKGWIPEGKTWSRVFHANLRPAGEVEVGNYDDVIRHLVSETGDDCGWSIKSDGKWITEPLTHVKIGLQGALGLSTKEATAIIGSSVFRHWRLVNKPFKPEYPGDREWNRGAAQFRYHPTENRDNLQYPTWMRVLRHCGRGLDDAIRKHGWCKANGILTGADYLKVWVASLFQFPQNPLPYLFLYSQEQNTGKSIFHECLSELVTHGVARADTALTNQSGFNGELANAVLCVIEEIDLSRSKVAYNRIKDWVTSRHLPVHEKGQTPYTIPNSTHWVQTANDHRYCPVFPGDTRITMIHVTPLDPTELIPKTRLIELLRKEASDFMAEILSLEIPNSNDRLNVPVISTGEKINAQRANLTRLQAFIQECAYEVTGRMIKYSEFVERFHEWLDPNDVHEWSKIKTGNNLPPHFPKGRRPQDGQFYVGNIWWEPRKPNEPILPKLVLNSKELLVPVGDE